VDNIRAGWRWAIEQREMALIDQYLASLCWLGEMRCWHREMAQMFGEAVERLKTQLLPAIDLAKHPTDSILRLTLARTLYCQARHIWHLALPAEAERLCRESLAIWPATKSTEPYATERGHVKVLLGEALYDQGRYSESEQICHEAMNESITLNDQYGLERTLYVLGINVYTQGNFARARQLLEESLAIANGLGDEIGASDALAMLGEIYSNQGDHLRAEECAIRVREISKRFGLMRGTACSLIHLGYSALLTGRLSESRTHFEQALAIGEEIADNFVRLNCRRWLGNIAYQDSRYAASRQYFAEALEIAQSIHRQTDAGIALTGLGRAACATADYDIAQLRFERAIQILQETGALPDLLDALAGLAELWMRTGQSERAARLLAFVHCQPMLMPLTRQHLARLMAEVQAPMPVEEWDAAYASGKSITMDEAIR
jgi:tetratricopeptide (TPR) repeat protein